MYTRFCMVAAGLLISGAWLIGDDAAKGSSVTMPAPQRWAKDGPGGLPGFQRHIQPLLGKMGCNSRACHGSFQGQGGLRFSLFSSDPTMDHTALVKGKDSPRIDLKNPDESLVLQKPTTQIDHKGGKRFEIDSWQYRLFRSWIAGGAPYSPGKETLVERLEVTPSEAVLKQGDHAQLRIVAHFSDKTIEDVTALTLFSSNDEVTASVNDAGLITAGNYGDTAVVVTFGGSVSTAHILVPIPDSDRNFAFPFNNKIDELAAAKWRKLGLQPSALADDAEFLRRVSLDLIGTLPTSAEVRKFLDDKDPKKRSNKIDELLNRPEYSLFWATKFADLTGNDDRFLPQPRPKYAWMWYDWLKDKMQKNVPYDELVAGFVTATSREGKSLDEYLAEQKKIDEEMTKDYDVPSFAQRKTNDIFWKKAGNTGDQVALQISYAFLGIRLECAQCHKHPFDRWTQDDFKGFTAFVTPVRNAVPSDLPKERVEMAGKGKQAVNIKEIFVQLAPAKGQGGGKNKNNGDATKGPKPRALGGSQYPLEEGKDPRVALMEWMRQKDNPFFAKAIVNRMWAHYFGAGIVNPPDDMNAANPPSNPELFDWLAADFVEHKFDLKHLHRTILNSRVYQLTWKPNATNALDQRNFSHAQIRRLEAEVIVDALDEVTGTKENYGNNFAPNGTRAIGLAPSRLNNRGPGYALAIFGRPLRTQTCDCERSMDPGLPQAMYLLNDVDVNRKVGAPAGRMAKLLKSMPDNKQLVEELYLTTLNRNPTEAEIKKSLDYVGKAASRQAGFEDLMWSLINTREFVFNH